MPPYNSDLEEIKNRIDIIDLISEYVSLKKSGQNWKGLCPFHSEKTPSFIVSPVKQIFHCFGCGTGGDVFTFLVRHENLSFHEAIKELAKRAGITLRLSRGDTAKSGEKEALLNLNKDALVFFQHALEKNSRAMNYLKKRDIHNKGQGLFSIGYAPKTWNALLSHLEGKGYKTEAIKNAGLISQGTKGYFDTFRDRLIFPIFDLRGSVVGFGGRALDNSEPKYLNSPETLIFNKRKILYGLNLAKDSIKKAGYVLFMEGYLDVITAHLHGFSNSVAPLGTAITQEHGKLIKRFTEEAVIVFDSDQAGVKAAKNAANILLENGLNVKILSFPENEDPDSFIRKNGREAFGDLLKNSLSIIDFLVLQGRDKRSIAREAIEAISRIPDGILQGSYVKLLSEKLGINEFFIIEELKRLKKRFRSENKTDISMISSVPRPVEEVYILKLLQQCPEKAERIFETFSEEDFKDQVARRIFKKIKEGVTDFNRLILEGDDEEKNLLTKVLFVDDFEDTEKVLNDVCLKLYKTKKHQTMQELQARIRDAELKGDSELLNNLLKMLQMEQHRLPKSGSV